MERAEIPDSAFDGIHVGHIALACALGCVMTMVAVAAADFQEALYFPLSSTSVWFYWPLAAGALVFAIAALLRRRWLAASAALAINAVTLIPTSLLVLACAYGDCL